MSEFNKGGSLKLYLTVLLVVLLSFLILAFIILSSVPPVSRDALTHHLAVPKLYLTHGGIYKIPSIIFSFYPMNLELLYMIPLYFGNDIIPKFIHCFFGLLTAALLFGYLKKRLNSLYALLGVLFFLSIPIVVRLSISIYVDLGLVFFSTAALIYLLKWVESRFKFKFIVVSAIWCGLALGTKYNGLVVLFLLTLFIPFIYSRIKGGGFLNSSKALGYGATFMIVALLVFSPWMIRNYLWTKNPIYPLYQNWFKPAKVKSEFIPAPPSQSGQSVKSRTQTKRSKNTLGHFYLRMQVHNESGWEVGLIPLRIFFQGEDGNPKYFDGKLNPLLLLLPFFAFGGQRRDPPVLRREKWILLSFALLFLGITFFKTDMRVRYIAPLIPPLVILSMFGLNRLQALFSRLPPLHSGNFSNLLTAVIVVFYLGYNAVYVVSQFRNVKPVSYLTGRKSREAYIEDYRREFPVFQFANQNLPDNAKILRFFLGNRIYFSERETVSGMSLFYSAVQRSDTADILLLSLKEQGLTHMIIRRDLFQNWLNNNFNDTKKRIIGEFFNHSRLLFYKNGYGLFEI